MIVEAGDLGGSAEIVKKFGAATHASVIAFYEETDAERAVYAKALAKELGIAFDRDAEDYFLTALPADRGLARQEIEKLALYAYDLGRNVSVEDLEALMAAEADSALDAASLAGAQGKAAHAVESLARIDALSGVSALRALLRRLHQLRDARILIDGGMSSDEAIAKLRPPVFWKERDAVAAQARLWTSKKLNAAYDVLWTAEMWSKTAGCPTRADCGRCLSRRREARRQLSRVARTPGPARLSAWRAGHESQSQASSGRGRGGDRCSREQRIAELGLNTDRAVVIIPATKIYLNAMKWSRSTKIFVPKIGLSDGIVKAMYNGTI